MIEMVGRDLFMRHTSTDGQSYVHCHRTWNAELFISSQQDAVARVNADAAKKGEPAGAKAEQITEAQYLKEKK